MRKNNFRLRCWAFCAALCLLLLPVAQLRAADHGDAPGSSNDLGADINDVYLFLDPNDNSKVIILLTVHGFIAAGENANFGVFDTALRYRLNLEFTGDASADATIDMRFSRRLAVNGVPAAQMATVTLNGFAGNRTFQAPATNPSATLAVAPDSVVTTDSTTGIQFFAGLSDDPFFFDIPAFSRFAASARAGTPNPAVFQRGRDSFAGYNTLSVGFSIPIALVRANGNNSLGVFAQTQRQSPQVYNTRTGQIQGFGRWVTVDRMGNPAVNVALVPFNNKDEFNSATPVDDANLRFLGPIASTLAVFGTDQTSVNILRSIAIDRGEIIRLDLTIGNTGNGGGTNVGAGFPNGRRLQDDVVDILNFLLNNRNPLPDNANSNDIPLRNTFPFLALPQQPREPGVIDDNTRN